MVGGSVLRTFIDSMRDFLEQGETLATKASAPLLSGARAQMSNLRLLLWIVFAVGFVARLSPLLDFEGRLFWQYMSEDGYLMQTIARNMALGLGMSTSEGQIATNGVQPLATYLFAGLHWIAGGERQMSIALVTVVSAVIAALGAYILYRLCLVLLSGIALREELARFVAAFWFVGPLNIAHTMNGLETGLYVLTVLSTLYYFVTRLDAQSSGVQWRPAIVLGFLLGLTFLARNDAIFFIAALLLSHLFVGAKDRLSLQRRFLECLTAGATSVLIGLPWLVNNYILFGSIVPISGISQSYVASFGDNLARIPLALLETMVPLLPIPGKFETNAVLIAVSIVILAAVLTAYWRLWGQRNPATRRVFVTSVLFVGALSLYYGLLFGAAHFIPRYLSIGSPLLSFVFVVVGYFCLFALPRMPQLLTPMLTSAAAMLALYAIAVSANFYRNGTQHLHKQVVDWVGNHATPSDWVGAVQTGTLGYFHDRTLNLDGKVNPAALRELLAHNHVLDYVVDTPVRYIADWYGMSGWKDNPQAGTFVRHFELIVADKDQNLSVYRRTTEPPPRPPSGLQE